MELTKNELAIADRYISKRERQLERWPRTRWLMLVIYSVMALVGSWTVSNGERDISNDKTTDMEISRAFGATPPPGLENRWAVGTMIKMGKILEARHQLVSYALIQVAIGLVQILCGLSMVCVTLVRWNTVERDALICKLLRGKLQELEQAAAPNTRPPPLPS